MNKYIQAIGIWFLIIPLAIINGGLRENILIKLGDMALPLSGIILSICIFLVAYLLIPKIKNCKQTDYFIFGIIWFVLTNLFDLFMYISEGGGMKDLLGSYNFLTGNLWILVVITTLISPIVVSKIKMKKGGVKMYKTVVIEYSPKADEMAQKIEKKANEMLQEDYELVTMSITGTAKAILVFKKV